MAGDRAGARRCAPAVLGLAALLIGAAARGDASAPAAPVPAAPVPVAAAPALTLPFDGVWGVVQGFDSGETHHGYAAFALDFAPPQDVGQFARLVHPRLEDFACYGRPVLAPADGQVVRVATGLPDLPPYAKVDAARPARSAKRRAKAVRAPSDQPSPQAGGSGNFVIIQHAPRVYTELVHLKAGSVRVAVGERVRRGQPVGACGNSGSARTPHLHLGLLSSIDPISTTRMPLSGYQVRRADGRWGPGDGEPKQGEWIRPDPPPPAPPPALPPVPAGGQSSGR
jgi:murein DD-endopeptidase MepM/ murein hydrolase activator NlpD